MSDRHTALALMNAIGEEVTWEFLKTHGIWYVWASHRGAEKNSDNFKFSTSGKTLTGCIRRLHDDVLEIGPRWVRP